MKAIYKNSMNKVEDKEKLTGIICHKKNIRRNKHIRDVLESCVCLRKNYYLLQT